MPEAKFVRRGKHLGIGFMVLEEDGKYSVRLEAATNKSAALAGANMQLLNNLASADKAEDAIDALLESIPKKPAVASET